MVWHRLDDIFLQNNQIRYIPQIDHEGHAFEFIAQRYSWPWSKKFPIYNIDGLVQERRNSIANALELHLSCTNPSI